MSLSGFFDLLGRAQFRFYQERDLGLDLYHNGWPGVALAGLAVAAIVVFLLAIFHVIPSRKHVTALLLGIGLVAALTGFATSYAHATHLEQLEPRILRDTAGPRPTTEEQRAAIVALPLVVGGATLAVSGLGWLYIAVFWAMGKQKPA
jgi:hypothetical protein